jgi:hypothetical protein
MYMHSDTLDLLIYIRLLKIIMIFLVKKKEFQPW